MKKAFIFFVFVALLSCATQNPIQSNAVYETENLKIIKFSDNVYQHISYLETKSYGNVPCNGMIIVDNHESVIFDTTIDNVSSQELISFVKNNLQAEIKAIVPTHFHVDCLGGLQAFHDKEIPSYALEKTIQLAAENDVKTLPQNAFQDRKVFDFGKSSVIAVYLGEGHTRDNIVAYYTDGKALFGGCLVKEIDAGKGNLADANVENWAKTIKNVQRQYKQAQLVIPGHGDAGTTDLLKYTKFLFENK